MSAEAAGSKRSSDGGNWGGAKKAREDSVTLRFLLQSKHAGGIIGKGGETIKRLRSEFSATVTVPDTNTGERILTIGADRDNCINVLKECLPLVHEPPYPVNAGGRGPKEPCQFEIDFLVHSSQVGGIIGKGGSRIKQIREETSAWIKVYQDCLPDCTERVVAVGGSEEQVINAMQQILNVLENEPVKGQVTLYDASYEHGQQGGYYDNYNNNYNGPPNPGMGGNNMGPGGMRGGMGGRGQGPPGGNFGGGPQGRYGGGMGQDFSNNYSNDNFNNYDQGPPQGNTHGNYDSGYNNFGNNSNGSASTTQVTVPNDMAGAIIGKGGERIRGIRQKCGADIKFTESETNNKERLITISGSQDQIQYAQYLMQQCVRENYRS